MFPTPDHECAPGEKMRGPGDLPEPGTGETDGEGQGTGGLRVPQVGAVPRDPQQQEVSTK